jgi:hypothetical protein
LYIDAHKGKVQNAMTLLDAQQAVVNTFAVPAKALVDAPQIADAIEKGVNTFKEAVPVLMEVLDEVTKVHLVWATRLRVYRLLLVDF